MFGFGKKNREADSQNAPVDKRTAAQEDAAAAAATVVKVVRATTSATPLPPLHDKNPDDSSLYSRLKQGLSRTGAVLNSDVRDLVKVGRKIDDALLEDLENQLLSADVGIAASNEIIADLHQRVLHKSLKDGDALLAALKEKMIAILTPAAQPLVIPPEPRPFVILVVGINGAGKTTTIGKLAKKLQLQGAKVMLAAGDTFRAAAVEQLQIWGDRNQIAVISQSGKADSASVIFDAVTAARARDSDILIADTAGRLHTQNNLMDELKKVKRVLTKAMPDAPHETLLILDAGTGQNGLIQAQQFHQAIGVTGIALTKLDGTAKGGILFAIAKELQLPVRFIGVGEGVDDLRPFDAHEFVNALFTTPLSSNAP
ncbi:MAG: signal recognition particle-docking protein FtsY [Gammaproteobacteria bacterium]|nr:signal recognition particle-docking protein FtsY [Gammaproteobacteria bacterium]